MKKEQKVTASSLYIYVIPKQMGAIKRVTILNMLGDPIKLVRYLSNIFEIEKCLETMRLY